MIELARHRLEVLIADTVTEREREVRRLTGAERTDLIIVLTELHRQQEAQGRTISGSLDHPDLAQSSGQQYDSQRQRDPPKEAFMTNRTEAYQPTAIEMATQRTLEMLTQAVTVTYKTQRVEQQQGTTEAEFRRILALYFFDKTIADWCHDLGIQDATDPHGGAS
jgi:hypothetical protein